MGLQIPSTAGLSGSNNTALMTIFTAKFVTRAVYLLLPNACGFRYLYTTTVLIMQDRGLALSHMVHAHCKSWRPCLLTTTCRYMYHWTNNVVIYEPDDTFDILYFNKRRAIQLCLGPIIKCHTKILSTIRVLWYRRAFSRDFLVKKKHAKWPQKLPLFEVIICSIVFGNFQLLWSASVEATMPIQKFKWFPSLSRKQF